MAKKLALLVLNMCQKNELLLLLFVYILTRVTSNPLPLISKHETTSTCQNCHKSDINKINVHLVPHSHDDVGWLRTVDQYYIGTGDFSSNAEAGVKYILDSTIEALQKNKNRRYIQVETAYFWKWWQNQDNETKSAVRSLVDNGNLEIINGAWSMNDEAVTSYQSIIDQFTWGFRILNKHLGKCGQPSVGWQIDPFGHSKEHAWLMKQFGFEGLFLGRIDEDDKARRNGESDLDFFWKASSSFDDSEIFTSILPNMYTYERGFCFDSTCPNQNEITDGNKIQKVDDFVTLLDKYRSYYKTKNVLIPMGGDFTYQKAEENFASIDKLIQAFENHETYNVFYSTPTCYIRAVVEETKNNKINLTQKNDDFFPYSSDKHSYWTGYFTSRPTLKRFERLGNNILQSAKQLMTFSRIKNSTQYDTEINSLREAMGILQHHDAITGTAKQAVTDDYSKILHSAIKKAEEPIGVIVGNLLKKEDVEAIDLELSTCLLANVSICPISQENVFLVVVQNPLSHDVTHYVHLPVDGTSYKITGPDGEEEYDVFDTPHDFSFVTGQSGASKELVFAARNLPPLGIRVYYIKKLSQEADIHYKPFREFDKNDSGSFGDETNGFTVDKETGLLESVTINGITQKISQEFLYYKASVQYPRHSGAYVFRPATNSAYEMNGRIAKWEFARGNLVNEFRQVINSEVSQVIKVYKNGESYIHFDWLVGNLQKDGIYGKEVITRFLVEGLNNNGTFYTDSNGRQMIKRQRNTRETFTYDATIEPVSSNYYPVTSKILIKDKSKDLTVVVLNDRAQGGSSLEDGTIELMVHRRLFLDDGFGVDEALDEEQYDKGLYARGQHYLTFGLTDAKILKQKKILEPWILVGRVNSSLEEIQNLIIFEFKGLNTSLPENVEILTLEPWMDCYILRVENIAEKDELSLEIDVNLKDAFPLFKIAQIMETPLGANVIENDWKNATDDLLNIKLKPYEIKTFLIKTDKNNEGGNDDNSGDDDDEDDDKNNAYVLSPPAMLILCLISLYL